MTALDRRQGVTGEVGIKYPVRVAATANLTLAGLQTVDGVALTDGDAVLAAAQTDATERLIYIATTSSWSLRADSDGAGDLVCGSLVVAAEGTVNGGRMLRLATTGAITIGTTALSWVDAGLEGATGPKGDTGAAGVDGINGTNGLNGTDGAPGPLFRVTAQGTPDMTIAIAGGDIQNGTTRTTVSAQNTAVLTAPVANPRNDLVVIDQTTGVQSVVAGTEAAAPADPVVPSDKTVLARIRLTVGMSSITNTDIDDLRSLYVISNHAVGGGARNLRMSVTAASATANMTADEIVVACALGGPTYKIGSFNQSVNLATVGAGGMDTGSAPVSGYVALYVIYNPTTKTSSLLAVNATSAAVGEVYGGAYMPAGYTASALATVWPTNASGNLVVGMQTGREIYVAGGTALTTTTVAASPTLVSLASYVPPNAKTVSGNMQIGANTASNISLWIYPSSGGFCGRNAAVNSTAQVSTFACPFHALMMLNAQSIYYTVTNSAGSFTATIEVNSYAI